jgi:hypothetical protein
MHDTTTIDTPKMTGRRARRARLNTAASAGGSLSDILGTLVAKGSLTDRQVSAGEWFYGKLCSYGGSSGGTVAAYKVRIDSGARNHGQPSGWNEDHLALQWVLDNLRPHERALMGWLVNYGERPTGRRSLGYWVLEHVGMDLPRQTAVTYAVGHVQCLLETIADLCDAYAQRTPGTKSPYARFAQRPAAA